MGTLGLRLSSSAPLPLPPPKLLQNPNPNPRINGGVAPLRPLSPAIFSSAGDDAGLRFREKLLYLENELGIDSSRALTLDPALRSTPLPALRRSAGALCRAFGLRPGDAARVLSMYPRLLTDPAGDALLRPPRDFLLGPAGIPFPDLRLAVARCPRLLVSSVPGRLLPALYFLRRLGFVGPRRITCSTTVLLVSSVEDTLIPKLNYLQSLGFSYRETKKMVLRSPGLLTFSIENNFRPKVEFLVKEMGRDVAELKDFPQYFSFSLEGKIKPRHRLLLENGFSMPLSEMLKVSDGEFKARLVEMLLRTVDYGNL